MMAPLARGISLSILVLFFVCVASCGRHLKEQVWTNPDAKLNLLIAADASEYKDALRETIIGNYRDKANIRVVNINALPDIPHEDFDAILIMDTCMAWTYFNPTVMAFLEQPNVQKRVVWFMTVDDTDVDYQHQGVDAITAASITANQESVLAHLSQQLDAILLKQP